MRRGRKKGEEISGRERGSKERPEIKIREGR